MGEEKKAPGAFRATPLVMKDESGQDVTLYILEETRLHGCSYILAVDSEEEKDGACYLLKDVSGAEDAEAVYEFVENEEEAGYMLEVFQTILEDEGAEVDLRNE